MAETGIKIKDAPLTGSISGGMKMPISDGSDLPKTTSVTQLYNFVKSGLLNTDGFALTSNIPTRTSQLTNDSSFATTSQIPTAVSKLTNDSGFITEAALTPYAKTANIPTKTSQLTNDSKYATTSEIPTKVSQLDNDAKYATTPVTDALAKSVAQNESDIERLIESHDTLGHAKALSLDMMTLPNIIGVPWLVISTDVPSTTPVFVGQIYLDKTNKKVYFAFGVSSSSDWVVLN